MGVGRSCVSVDGRRRLPLPHRQHTAHFRHAGLWASRIRPAARTWLQQSRSRSGPPDPGRDDAPQTNPVGHGGSIAVGGAAAVAGVIDKLDLKTSQRLHLAATDCGLPLLLLRPAQTLELSAAATRWRIGTAAAARDRFGLFARPRWHLQLERCRNGRPGEWVVEYDHVAHRFSLAAALADPALSRRARQQRASETRQASRLIPTGRSSLPLPPPGDRASPP